MIRARVFVGGVFRELVFGSYSQFEKWFGADPHKTNEHGGIKILNLDRI